MLQKMFPQNGKRVPEIRFAGFLQTIGNSVSKLGRRWLHLSTEELILKMNC